MVCRGHSISHCLPIVPAILGGHHLSGLFILFFLSIGLWTSDSGAEIHVPLVIGGSKS